MGWKLPCSLEQYALYTFGRLTTPLCRQEFKRRLKRCLSDHFKAGRRSRLKARVYADFIFALACSTGVGWALAVLTVMLVYTVCKDWKRVGGYRMILVCWRDKLYGATKPLDLRGRKIVG